MSGEDFQNEEAFLQEQQRNEEILKRGKMQDVDFGMKVQSFLDGPIGQRILSDAEAEMKDLTSELVTLDVDNDKQRFRILLARAQVLQHWQDCFGHYIITGKNAERELESMD